MSTPVHLINPFLSPARPICRTLEKGPLMTHDLGLCNCPACKGALSRYKAREGLKFVEVARD
jgi:hypothetical protein